MNNLIKLLPKRIYIVGYTLQDTYKDEPDDVIVKIYDDFNLANQHYMYLKTHVAFRNNYADMLEPYLQTRFIGTMWKPNDFQNANFMLYGDSINPSQGYPIILLQLYAVQFINWEQPVEEYNAYWDIPYDVAFDFLYKYFERVDEQDVHPDIVNWLKSNPY
jgi:hypothetical protein